MTVNELVEYYQSLLILQYRSKVKALATIDAMVRPTAVDLLPTDMQDAFNIDTAVGVQLDLLGKYIGIERKVYTFTDLIILNDSDYRFILKIKRALNSIGSSMYDIQYFISNQLSGSISIFDQKNMTMSYFLDSNHISPSLTEALIRQHLLPKPMAVNIDIVVYIPNANNIFGFVSYDNQTSTGISGFNKYSDYSLVAPWLSYSDIVTI